MSSGFTCQLANRGVLALGGADRRAFLQGLISNDIELCVDGRAIHAALLTPQGKFLHEMFVVEAGDELLIDCEAARAEDLAKRLNAFKLRAKIEVRTTGFGVWVEFSPDLSFPRKRESIASDSEHIRIQN